MQAEAAVDVQSGIKTCRRCGLDRPAIGFSRLKKSKDGLHSWCKACCAEARRLDRKVRPEHYASINAKSHQKHRDADIARQRASYWANREKNLERMRNKPKEVRDRHNAARRKALECPEVKARKAQTTKAWRDKNSERLKEQQRARWAAKPNSEKLRTYFGAAISHAIKGRTKGGRSWTKLVGYGLQELRAHLELQFLPGMTWENYGEWHIDHIIPVASFTYESYDSEEFKRCWGLPNLRPLWGKENIGKGARRLFLL